MSKLAEDYKAWVTKEAAAIHSDGCSFVGRFDGQLHECCCYEHDLAYFYAKDPRVAFLHGWTNAPAIARREVDRRFRECNMSMSPFGRFSPIAWARWVGVRLGGGKPWAQHRADEKSKG